MAGHLGLFLCLTAVAVPPVSLVSHALLLPLHYSRGYLRPLSCLIAAVVPSVRLGSHILELPLYSLGLFLGLLKCLAAAVVPFLCLGSHPFLLTLYYLEVDLGLLMCSFATVVPFLSLGPTCSNSCTQQGILGTINMFNLTCGPFRWSRSPSPTHELVVFGTKKYLIASVVPSVVIGAQCSPNVLQQRALDC